MSPVFFLSFITVMIAACVVMLCRNDLVYRMRIKMINTIFSYLDWQWRMKEYEKINYFQMVNCFWKWPVKPETFYADTSFLKPTDGLVKSPFQLNV